MRKFLVGLLLAVTVAGFAGAATKPVPCDPKATVKKSCVPAEAGKNGDGVGITDGAKPGTAGVPGNDRPDGFNGANYGSVVVDAAAGSESALITDETAPQGANASPSGDSSSNPLTRGAVPESPAQSQEAALITDNSQQASSPPATMASATGSDGANYSPPDQGGSASPTVGDALAAGLQDMAQNLADSNPWNSPTARAANAANARAATQRNAPASTTPRGPVSTAPKCGGAHWAC